MRREAGEGNDAAGQAALQLAALIESIDAYREATKSSLEARLNEFLYAFTPKCAGDKKQVAELLTLSLKRLGLAIEYEGQRCAVYATSGARSPHGRFMITPSGSSKPLAEPASLASIMPLKLTTATAPIVPSLLKRPSEPGGWRNRIARDPKHERGRDR